MAEDRGRQGGRGRWGDWEGEREGERERGRERDRDREVPPMPAAWRGCQLPDSRSTRKRLPNTRSRRSAKTTTQMFVSLRSKRLAGVAKLERSPTPRSKSSHRTWRATQRQPSPRISCIDAPSRRSSRHSSPPRLHTTRLSASRSKAEKVCIPPPGFSVGLWGLGFGVEGLGFGSRASDPRGPDKRNTARSKLGLHLRRGDAYPGQEAPRGARASVMVWGSGFRV